jgi:hypothetical protein
MSKFNCFIFFIYSTICLSQNQESIEIKSAQKHFENHYSQMNLKPSRLEPINFKVNHYLIGKDTLYIKNDSISNLLIENKIFNHFLSENSNQTQTILLTGLKFIERNEKNNSIRFQVYRNVKCDPKLVEVCLSNPVIYYFEIKSECENCNENNFYNNIKMTYLRKGGILL